MTKDRDGELRIPLLLNFFLLVFALSVPFWLAVGMTKLELMPGLSVGALMAFCPMAAALILVQRQAGTAGMAKLLRRAFDFNRIRAKRWFVPIFLLMAGVNVAVYGLMRSADTPLPTPQIQLSEAALMFAAFFVGALGEELGWSGYSTDPIQQRCNALQTGVLLGAVTVLWHLPPLLLMNRSPTWVAWWCR